MNENDLSESYKNLERAIKGPSVADIVSMWIVVVGLWVLSFIVGGWILSIAWNAVIVAVFALPALTIGQGVWLLVILYITGLFFARPRKLRR